jgi:hypothetical protein
LNDENNSVSFFFFFFFFFFLPRIDTLIFHSTRCSANITIVILPGVKNRRENKFFLFQCFSLSIRVFFLLCPNSNRACTTLKDLFFCLSPPLFLSLFSLSLLALSSLQPTLFSTATMCNHHFICEHKKRQV